MTGRSRCFAARCIAAACFLALGICGCGDDGPALGEVGGTVTLDGKPLPDAWVIFEPAEPGPDSVGTTDELGHYDLRYNARKTGAWVGQHTVRIGTGTVGGGDEEAGPRKPERVAPNFNKDSSLRVEVERGENTHDFALTSK